MPRIRTIILSALAITLAGCQATTVSSGLDGRSTPPSEISDRSASTLDSAQSGTDSYLDTSVASAIDLALEAAELAFSDVRTSRDGTKIYVSNRSFLMGNAEAVIEPLLFQDRKTKKTGVAFEIKSEGVGRNFSMLPSYVNHLFFEKLRPLLADNDIGTISLSDPKRLREKGIAGTAPAFIPTTMSGFKRYIDQKSDRDQFEGIWVDDRSIYTMGLFRDDGDARFPYKAFIISSGVRQWKSGEIKLRFSKLDNTGIATALIGNRVKLVRGVTFQGDEDVLSSISRAGLADFALIKTYPTNKTAERSAGTGTAWYLGDNLFATNAHVVRRARNIEVSNGKIKLPGRVEAIDEKLDLALILVDGALPGFTAFKIGRTPKIGTKIFALGFPLSRSIGKDIKMTDGLVSATSGLGKDPTQIQMSVPVQPGNSGGPVVAADGRVVGVVVSKLSNRASPKTGVENVNFAVKPEYLRALLPEKLQSITTAGAEIPATEICERLCKSVFLVTVR